MFLFEDEHLMSELMDMRKPLTRIALRKALLPRKLIQAVILLVMLAVSPANGAIELALNVSAGSASAQIGDLVTVTLDVAGLTVPINGIQAFVHYDENILRLVDVQGNDSVGAGWTAFTEDRGGGDLIELLVMFGGQTAINHSAATMTFEAIAIGSTSVIFLPDDPPLRVKLTVASDASPILPITIASTEIMVSAADVPTVSQWGITTMALLLMTMGSLILRKCKPPYASMSNGSR